MSKLYTCTKCNKKKQEMEFYKNTQGSRPVRSWCKKCYSVDNKQRYIKNPDFIKENRKNYFKENKDVEVLKMKQYYESNKDKFLFYSSKRRAQKKLAYPTWLSSFDAAKIKSIYKMCRQISKKTGLQHHVDHIIPLQSELVCGLHVPWNLQIIPSFENIKKHNSFNEDMV